MAATTDSSPEPSFRTVLPHEPPPEEDTGYLHIQGSFEPKKPKKEAKGDQQKDEACYYWTTAQSLHDAISQSPTVQSLEGLTNIELLDKDPPFTKIRLMFDSPQAASKALQKWRKEKLRPCDVLLIIDNDHPFSSRQLQMSQITKAPMLSTDTAWTRSTPPKFRRLLHSNASAVDRSQARFVFVSGLIPENTPPPNGWDEAAAIATIRNVMNDYDSTGHGVEVFVPHKSVAVYQCHVGMRIPEDAQKIILSLQGTSVEWKLPNGIVVTSPKLFLDYADITQRSVQRGKRTDGLEVIKGEPSRPECTSMTNDVTVPGLMLIPEYVSPEEETVLLAALTGPQAPWAPSQQNPSQTGSVRRRVQHYGYVFDYETANVLRDRQPNNAACPPLPSVDLNDETVEECLERCVKEGRGWETLAGVLQRTRGYEFDGKKRFPAINQLTVNEYRQGEGIGSHVDTPTAFGDGLMSLSLKSGIVMEFKKANDTTMKKLVYLPPRSLLVLTGSARYEWEHMIVSRRTDTHDGVVKPRGLRISLTLRTALKEPLGNGEAATEALERVESKSFPPVWQTHAASSSTTSTTTALVTPETERQHVHAVYDAIATQWHHTRGKRGVLWPGATQFLKQLPSGSIVADVGCGDGKYFPAIWEAGSYVIGTDISRPLLLTSMTGTETAETRQVSAHRTQLRNRPAVAVADCMNVPLRDKSVDAAICIAVLHHLSTPERRHRCLSELARIVKPGGLINVQAWAMEQDEGSRRKFASTDVFVPFNAQPKYLDKEQQKQTTNESSPAAGSSSVAEIFAQNYDGAEYDERKGLVVFQRYCHLYREGELETLVGTVDGVEMVESGYESGNHFMILRVLA